MASLVSLTESLQEPAASVHPTNPRVMAIGVNAAHTTGLVPLGRVEAGVDVFPMNIYFTEDGGEAWRQASVPHVTTPPHAAPVEDTIFADPTIGFDREGRLHVAGMVANHGGNERYSIFYTSTADLGKTWTTPRVFDTPEIDDRPWLTVGDEGRLYVTWYHVRAEGGDLNPGRVEVLPPNLAWSLDGGASWKVIPVSLESEAECRGVPTPVVEFASAVFLACNAMQDSKFAGARFLEFDPLDGAFELRSSWQPKWGASRFLVAGPLGPVTLGLGNDQAISATASMNGGQGWTEPVDLRSLFRSEDGWRVVLLPGAAADPWGGVHLLLRDQSQCGGTLDPSRHCRNGPVSHAAFDPLRGIRLTEMVLKAPAATDAGRVPPSLAPPAADDYLAIAFGSEQGLLAWTFDRGLDYTYVRPVAP